MSEIIEDSALPKGYPRFTTEYAKSGRSKCHYTKCQQLIAQDTVRIGKIVPHAFIDAPGAEMTTWYHPECLMSSSRFGKIKSQRIHNVDQIENFSSLRAADQKAIRKLVDKEEATRVETTFDAEEVVYMEHEDESKFWEISRGGKHTSVRRGAIGDDDAGLSTTKTHASKTDATAFMEKMIREKEKKGYSRAEKGKKKIQVKKEDVPDVERKYDRKRKKSDDDAGDDDDEDEKSTKRTKSDSGWPPGYPKFAAEYAKSGRSKCHHTTCQDYIDEGELRLGKVIPNPFIEQKKDATKIAEITQWYHVSCLFENAKRGRQKRERITSIDAIQGHEQIKAKDRTKLTKLIEKQEEARAELNFTPDKRVYCEYKTDDEHKFWEMAVSGAKTRVRWSVCSYGNMYDDGMLNIM